MAKRGRGRPKGSKNKPKMQVGPQAKGMNEAVLKRLIQDAVNKAFANAKIEVKLSMNKPRGRRPKA